MATQSQPHNDTALAASLAATNTRSAFASSRRRESDWRWTILQVWQGMTLTVWLRLLVHNRFAVSPRRWLPLLLATCCSISNSLLGMFSEAIYARRAKRTFVKPPLFIIGHWRTGTTLLHELLALDDRFNFPSTIACVYPHHFMLTERLFKFLGRWLLPATRVMDNMSNGTDRPQEDEFALCNLGLPSPYASLAVPRRAADYAATLDVEMLPSAERQRWQSGLMWFLRRLSVKDSRRLVLKSPTHTARIRAILDLFPDAQFVHITRDPYVLFPSTVHTWRSLRSIQSLQATDDSDLEEYVFDSFQRMYAAFDRDRHLIPPANLYELRYEDLTNDITGSLQSLYEHLRLGGFDDVRGKFREFENQSSAYRTNRYELPSALITKIAQRWKPQIKQWGYCRNLATSDPAAG